MLKIAVRCSRGTIAPLVFERKTGYQKKLPCRHFASMSNSKQITSPPHPVRIGILGGSFDPPHQGHITSAWEIINAGSCDRVILLPCGANRGDKSANVVATERLKMAQLAVDDDRKSMGIDDPARHLLTVDDTEIRNGSFIPTYRALSLLQDLYQGAELWWIIGSDLIEDLPKWDSGHQLVNEARFIIIPRPTGEHDDIEARCKATAVANWRDVASDANAQQKSFTATTISSTEIRRRLRHCDSKSFF
eukprot:Selendium_serpulae@DN5956_c4_g1_i5.p1